jgi:hypothetical protein
MKLCKPFVLLVLVSALATCSCYHEVFGGGTGGGGGGNNGNTFLNVTVTSTPSPLFSFPSLNWQIGAIDMVNSAGTSITLVSGGLPVSDFARLQTDSLYLGHVTIAATSYTSLKVQLNAPLFSYFYNSTSGTLFGCPTGTVCMIPGTVPGFGATTVTVPITYTATANANAGIRINFDLSKAVTNTGGMTFDFTQTGAITLSTLPPSSSQTSGLDTVDNFTGTVTGTTASTVTVSSFVSEARTFTMSATAEFDDPFAICPSPARFSCLAVNQNVSLDGVVNSDGTFTASEIEFLDPAPLTSELEGVIITPVTNNSLQMALTNGMGTSTLIQGSTVTVNLNNTETYFVDPKNLGITTTPLGFQSQSDLVLGQTVMLRGGTINTTNTSLNNSTRVLLRYSSIPGTVQTPGNPVFTLSNVSPFLTSLVSNSAQVQTFLTTAYDNITGINSLVTGTNASVRGLYLNPTSGVTQPILAAKVRTH